MNNYEYERPEIIVISVEPDEKLMESTPPSGYMSIVDPRPGFNPEE